jgi:superoxide dismutase, Cu-Zn family
LLRNYEKQGDIVIKNVVNTKRNGRTTVFVGGVVLGLVAMAGVVVVSSTASAKNVIATAELKLASGEKVGTVTFENPKNGDATVVIADFKFAQGVIQTGTFHGMHIHANDVATNGVGCVADPTKESNTWFTAVDGHFKQNESDQHSSHSGDLATVYINRDGTGHVETKIDRFVASQLFDRAVIFHADPDNYGNVPKGTAANQYTPNSAAATVATGNTGNAGDRLACGMIDVK